MPKSKKQQKCPKCERYKELLELCTKALGYVPQGADIFAVGCMKRVVEAINEAEKVLYYED